MIRESLFDAAVDAIVSGDLAALRALLERDPGLVHRRGRAPFEATLLHHVAANGVPDELQRSPAEAPEVCRLLLQAGAEPDALSSSYGGGPHQTTLCLLASSWHPFERGVQLDLIRELVRGGARVRGLGDDGAPLTTALVFGYTRAAELLFELGGSDGNLLHAAGLGRLADVRARFDAAGALRAGALASYRPVIERPAHAGAAEIVQDALHFAATHGRAAVAEFLLERGASPNGATPGHHATLPLVQALFVDEPGARELLLRRGADPDLACAKRGASALELARAGGRDAWIEAFERYRS